jgi:hypothetical protein
MNVAIKTKMMNKNVKLPKIGPILHSKIPQLAQQKIV